MARYQRRSVEVAAEQADVWTQVETAGGSVTVGPGDWIVTDAAGKRTVYGAEAFALEFAEALVVPPADSALPTPVEDVPPAESEEAPADTPAAEEPAPEAAVVPPVAVAEPPPADVGPI